MYLPGLYLDVGTYIPGDVRVMLYKLVFTGWMF